MVEEIENDRLTVCTIPVVVHVQVRVHILRDPQCSAEERYNNNNYPRSIHSAVKDKDRMYMILSMNRSI